MILEFILSVLAVFILLCIPGILAMFALLKGIPIGKLAKVILGSVTGTLAIPMLAFLESNFLGVSFTFPVVLVNSAIGFIVAGFLFYSAFPNFISDISGYFGRCSQAVTDATSDQGKMVSFAKRYWPVLALLFFMGLAFYVRISTSYAYNFFEFDPVFYNRVTQVLVTTGNVPIVSTDVYFPLNYSLRTYPLVHYMRGAWMLIGNAVSGYSITPEYVVGVSDFYPPLAAAFMCFLLYLIFKSMYSDWIGVIAAALGAMMPQLVSKLAAGVSDLQPFGIVAALFVFAIYLLAFHYNSRRLAILSAFAVAVAVLASAQYLWPVAVIGAFAVLAALLDYWNLRLDSNRLTIYALPLIAGIISGLLVFLYDVGNHTTLGNLVASLSNGFLFLAAALVFSVLLFLAQSFVTKQSKLGNFSSKHIVLAGLLILSLAAFILFPSLSNRVTSYISVTAGFAINGSPLSMTIQEQGQTTPDMYPSSFGQIDPNLTLLLAALAVSMVAVSNLFKSGKNIAAYIAMVIAAAALFLNGVVQQILNGVVAIFFSNNPILAHFISGSTVFIYLVVVLLLLSMDSIIAGTDQSELLLLSIAIFPVSYIGLNILKYLVHLALALCVALPLAFGAGELVLKGSAQSLDKDSRDFVLKMISCFFILLGVLAIYWMVSAPGLPIFPFQTFISSNSLSSTMGGLAASRIDSDWMGTYSWMQSSPLMSNSTCLNTYGYNCRVLSWWDYGHWTTFFGGKQSVLDPGNVHPEFDQEVAKSYVDGNLSDMLYTVRYHEVTTVLADAELLQKWGALVYLSGTCSTNQSPICFANPPIPSSASPGSSVYEAEHYFEFLTASGTCPSSASPVQLAEFKSSITGATYCLSNSQMFLLTQSGQLDPNYQRNFVVEQSYPIDTSTLNPTTSYLFPYQQGVLINANPDLTYAGLNNTVFYSAYTRLYLFESLPGFNLIYSSPSGEVKLFSVSKDFIDGNINLTTAEMPWLASPAASPAPSVAVSTNSQVNQTAPSGNSTSVNATVAPTNSTSGNSTGSANATNSS